MIWVLWLLYSRCYECAADGCVTEEDLGVEKLCKAEAQVCFVGVGEWDICISQWDKYDKFSWWVLEELWEQFIKGIKLSLILGMDWKIGNAGQNLIVEWFVVLYFDVWLLTETQWQMQWKLLWLCVWNLSTYQFNNKNSPGKHINVCFIKFSLVHCYVVILNTFVSINSFIVFRQNLWCFVYDCCVMLHSRGREGVQKVWNWTRSESLRCNMMSISTLYDHPLLILLSLI